jgi:O-antigen/teichoic acid export membrane protein
MSALRNGLWATLGNAGQQVFSLLTVVVVARLVSPSAFGQVAVASLVALLFQRMLLESVGFYVIRAREEEYSDAFLNTAFVASVAGGFSLALLLLLCAPWVAQAMGEPGLTNVLRVFGMMPVIDGLTTVQTALLRRGSRFKELALRTIASNLLSGVLGIGLAFSGAGVWALVAQQCFASFMSAVILWRVVDWRPMFRACTREEGSKLVQFALPMLGNAIVFVAVNRVDVVSVAATGGAHATGIYNLARRVVRTVNDLMVSGPVNVFLTGFSERQTDASARTALLLLNLKALCLITVPFFTGLSLVAGDLVPLVFGPAWVESIPLMAPLCLVGFVLVGQVLFNNVMVALGHSSSLFMRNLLGLLLLLALLWLWQGEGLQGVVWAVLVQAVAQLAITVHWVMKQLTLRLWPLLESMVTSLAAAGLMLAAMVIWNLIVPLPAVGVEPMLAYGRLAAEVTVLAVVYLLVVGVAERSFLVSVVQRLRKRRGV